MQSLTNREKDRLDELAALWQSSQEEGWRKELYVLEMADLLMKMLSLTRLQSHIKVKTEEEKKGDAKNDETCASVKDPEEENKSGDTKATKKNEEFIPMEDEDLDDLLDEIIAEDNARKKENEELEDKWYEETKDKKISRTDPLSNSEDLRMASLDEALYEALKSYDSEKGRFLGWFKYIYRNVLKTIYREEQQTPGHLDAIKTGVIVYKEPKVDAASLCQLRVNTPHIAYILSGRADCNPVGTWYKLRISVGGKKKTGYVLHSEDVIYKRYYNESQDSQSEDDTKIERPIVDAGQNPEELVITDELRKYFLFAEFLAFHKAGSGGKTDGGLSKQQYYHMFFTEDIICTLHTMSPGKKESFPHENLILANMEKTWMDYLLVEPCGSFSRIVEVPLHTYHDLFANDNHKRIKLSLETGVPIAVREPYVRDIYKVTQKFTTLKSSVSQTRTAYRADRNKYTGVVMEKPINTLADLFYEDSQN